MAEELFEVPLFPLHVVLFPGMALPLHIFEPRYRTMIGDCLADRAPFGVVLALPESEPQREVPAKAGTLARIADYERLPDDRYNVLALGTSRFEIVEPRYSRQYMTGLVRPLRDASDDPLDLPLLVTAARDALACYLRIVLSIVGSEQRQIEIPGEAEDLSYLIGMCLTCEDCEKQRLLELTSVAARLRIGTAKLRHETDLLRRQADSGTLHPHANDRAQLN
jgi:Lon protease-like protein